jgi:hypothetical protein
MAAAYVDMGDYILVMLGDVVMSLRVAMRRVAMGRGIRVRNYYIYMRHILKLPLYSG